MAFRRYGGLDYTSRNNMVRSILGTTSTASITQQVGQPDSTIIVESNIDFKNLSVDELNAELLNAEVQSQDLIYNHSISPLQNTQEIKIAKKIVARIKTELRSRELSSIGGLNRDKILARRKKERK